MKQNIGKNRYVKDGADMSDEFLRLSNEDEKVAKLLHKNKHFNQSVYYYIQSMEKYIKGYICKKVNVCNEFAAEELRSIGHSLDTAVDFFIEIMSGSNVVLKQQLQIQIKHDILKDIRFSSIYNAVRYPYYSNRHKSYSINDMTDKDCEFIENMYNSLKKHIIQMYNKM